MWRAGLRNKFSILCFSVIMTLGAFDRYLNGSIYSKAELLKLFSSLQTSGLYLGSAIVTSSGATLALM